VWRRLAFAALAVALAVPLVPLASAAPTVASSSTSAYAVTASDYFEFAPGSGNAVGTTWRVRSPDGTCLAFVKNTPTGTTPVRFNLDGTLTSGYSDGGWTVGTAILTPDCNTSLVGHPGDGTWIIQLVATAYTSSDSPNAVFSNVMPGPTLHVGTKGIHWGASPLAPSTVVQMWNQRNTASGTTWVEPSTVPSPTVGGVGAGDTPIEAADEDPNNAYFFSDVTGPVVSPFTAYTLNYLAPTACTTSPVSTVFGAWLGASGTAFSQVIYRAGNFLGTTDLRTVTGFAVTTEENEGATAAGTDSKSIPYNAAAGTSYQFKVRTATQGEVLGAVQWIPNALCSATIPSIVNLFHSDDAWEVTVSQAQCNQDPVSITMNGFLTGAGTGLTAASVTIYEAQTGAPRVTIPSSAFHVEGGFPNLVYSLSYVVPYGDYVALATADLTGGLGVKDFFDAYAFSVPRGECGDTTTDVSSILAAIAAANANETAYHDHLKDHLHTLESNDAAIIAALTAMSTSLASLQADTDALQVDTAALLAKWGPYTAATLVGYVDDLEVRLGNPGDACGTTTLFARVACVKADTVTIQGQVSGVSTQVSGVSSQVTAVQSTANAISSLLTELHSEVGAHGQSQTVYALLSSVYTLGGVLDAEIDALQSDLDTHEANSVDRHDNETAYLDHINEHLHALGADNITHQQILDALEALNITVTGNFTDLDNATYELLIEKLGAPGMPVEISNENLDYFLPVLIWAVALLIMLRYKKLLSASACSLGLMISLATDIPLAVHSLAVAALLVALWMEATGRDGIIQSWFSRGESRRAMQKEE